MAASKKYLPRLLPVLRNEASFLTKQEAVQEAFLKQAK